MKRLTFYLASIFFGITLSFSAQAQETNLTKNFGIGLQGTTPSFGGISFRYTGLAPVYLQTVGRFILTDESSDHMLGGGISYAIFEHQSRWNISRLYFTLEGGWQYNKERDFVTTTLGGGVAFGGEIVFSLGGIPLGLNVEVGQGFGGEKDDFGSEGLAGVYVGSGIHAYF
ncbi:hypothetical protein J5I95_09080 [Candidatus Poribacteria bacterium]|nr:hypothetical protein [Candidatus Poribacteria bacterium]